MGPEAREKKNRETLDVRRETGKAVGVAVAMSVIGRGISNVAPKSNSSDGVSGGKQQGPESAIQNPDLRSLNARDPDVSSYRSCSR